MLTEYELNNYYCPGHAILLKDCKECSDKIYQMRVERMDQLEKRIEILENNQKVLRSKTMIRG